MNADKQLKILILMPYYNRPLLVRNALKSILKNNTTHQNWHLFFGDDGSTIPGKPIVKDVLQNFLNQITFVESNLTLHEKLKQGLVLGKYANQALAQSDADVAIILCDDDELEPNYFFNLNKFFIENPDVLYAYSKVCMYNPIIQKSEDVKNLACKYNKYSEPINPVGKLDASQVAWRLDCCRKYGAWFADSTVFVEGKPWTRDTDKSFFQNLFDFCGDCHPTNFVGQYKGIHDYQLVWHKNVGVDELQAYDAMCKQLAGSKF